jgi:hypothetical protein
MELARHRRGAPEEVGGHVAEEPVALVRPLLVIELQEPVEGPLHRRATGEVLPAELDAPVLMQDRALQPLHEAVGPGMARLGAGVANAERLAGLIERPLELRAPVGQYAFERPPRLLITLSLRQTRTRRPAAQSTVRR